MSFAAREASRDAGRPYHLYRFAFGEDDVLAYCSVTTPIDHVGLTFEPLAISHGDITSSGGLDKSALPVTAPDEGPLAERWKDDVPQTVVNLTIWQGHIGEAELKVCFAGRVLSGAFGEDGLELQAEPIMSSLRRPGLNRDWQLTCPLVLYGSRCRADREAATRSATLSAVDGPNLVLAAGWAPDDLRVKHVGGVFTWQDSGGRTHRRSIEDVSGNQMRIASFVPDMASGQTVSVTLGCDHTMGDCKALHDNSQNFGGQPQIPLKNPVGITNPFY